MQKKCKLIINKRRLLVISFFIALLACVIFSVNSANFAYAQEDVSNTDAQPVAEAQATPSITVYPQTVPYNSQSQSLKDIHVILNNTEMSTNEYTVLYSNASYPQSVVPPIKAGEYTVTVTTNGVGHIQATASTTLTIEKIYPTFTYEGNFTEEYGSFKPIIAKVAFKYGEPTEFAQISYSFGEIKRPTVGAYKLTAVFLGNDNYKPYQETKNYAVTKRFITIEVSGSQDVIYSGLPITRIISRKGVLSDDVPTLKVVTTYNGNPSAIDADTYTIEFAVNNSNYEIGAISGGQQLIIRQKELVVTPNDVIVKAGEAPVFTYTYKGFVLNEDASVITTPPTITKLPTEFGEYFVTPSGAKAKNYRFIYNKAKFTINNSCLLGKVEDGSSDVTIKGSFSPNAAINIATILVEDEKGVAVCEKLKSHKQITNASAISYIYNISLLRGTNDGQYVNIKLTNVKFSKLFSNCVGVIDTKGDFHKISKYNVTKDGALEFNATDIGQVVIYKNTMPTFIIIGIAGLIVVAIVVYVILSAVVYNKKKKQGSKPVVSNNDDKYAKKENKYKW